MSKTIKLRDFFIEQLETTCLNVWYSKADSKSPFPYIVIDIAQIADNYQLEINIYDKSTSSTDIETIADKIDSLLHEATTLTDDFAVFILRNNRNKIHEGEGLQRIRQLFDIYYYGKEV
jgi:hypothetical protein